MAGFYFFCSLVITSIILDKALQSRKPTYELKQDIYPMVIGATLIILGFLVLSIYPEQFFLPELFKNDYQGRPKIGKYVLPVIILSIVIGLNAYFKNFWRQPFTISADIEIRKLKHSEWSYITNALILIFFGAFAVAIFTNLKDFVNSDRNNSTLLFEIFLIIYYTVFAPILWLLRPIHITMTIISTTAYFYIDKRNGIM